MCVCFTFELENTYIQTNSSKKNILFLLVAVVSENLFFHNLICYRKEEGRVLVKQDGGK